jgi:lipopolysaccharide export system protein LptC
MAAAGIELNLPDLPEVPIRLGTEPPRGPGPRVRQRLADRLRDALTAYLPLLLMVLLALGSWWLVKNSPQPQPERQARPVSGEPDYTMRGFSLQRFGPDGRLQVTLQGKQLHHYPQNDRIEIEELHLTAEAPSGRPTLATARKAISNSKASEVQLMGGAQIRTRTAAGQPVEIDSEYLQLFTESERVVTDKPVRARVGPNIMRAGGLVYDHKNAQLELKPPVRAELQPQSLPR